MKKIASVLLAGAAVLLPLGLVSAQVVTTPYSCGSYYSSVPCSHGNYSTNAYYGNGYSYSPYSYTNAHTNPYTYSNYGYYNNYQPSYPYGGSNWSLCYQGSVGGTTTYYPCMTSSNNQNLGYSNFNNAYYTGYPNYYANSYYW
jgi:hypothetical protein